MRAQKMREEAAEKARDEYFNTSRSVILTKQEWRVKEKASTPALTASDDMDLLDDDESTLIKDGSPLSTDMDINMVFTLAAEFRGTEEEVVQIFFDPKEVVFKKIEESSQHLKSLYVRGHINEKSISMMLIDGNVGVDLMSYSVFNKLGSKDDELVKTNRMLNGVGDNPMEDRGVISMELTIGSKPLATVFFVVEVQGNYSVILGRDWIHVNHCIHSTLHQFLIQ
jgi:hypothetical protein